MDLVTASCSNGLLLLDATKSEVKLLTRYGSNLASTFSFSLDGLKYAYSFYDCVKVHSAVNHELLFELPYKDIVKTTFSPDGNILAIYQSYKSDTTTHNMRFIELTSGKCIKEITQPRSNIWKPLWTNDSSICARLAQDEIHIYQDNKFAEAPSCRISAKNVHTFSLSSRGPNPNIAMFVAGQKGNPGYVSIHKIQDGQDMGVIIRKTFYKADYVNLMWNDRGTDLLVLATINESDKSYYGEQSLYFLTTSKGGEAANVQFPNESTISDVKWLPMPVEKANASNKKARNQPSLFAVCHGQLPTTVTVFGPDCEPKFVIGTGSWNMILPNTLGNLIILGGFGNISGNVTIWDVTKQQSVCSIKCEDTTHIAWCDDGIHFIAATTSPRLRVNNGFRVYNYKGELVNKWAVEKRAVPKPATADLPAMIYEELHSVVICPLAASKKPKACFESETGIIDPQVTGSGKKNTYVPPSLRNAKDNPNSGKRTGPVGGIVVNSASATADDSASRAKQITGIKTKLKQIEKLKAERASGKDLDAAQKKKVESEQSLIEQLTQLRLKQN